MAEEKKKLSLEEAFEKLETVIETLERPEPSLEESFQAYKEGVSLGQLCNIGGCGIPESVLHGGRNRGGTSFGSYE